MGFATGMPNGKRKQPMEADQVEELMAQLEAHEEANVKILDEEGQSLDVSDIRFDGDNTIIIETTK